MVCLNSEAHREKMMMSTHTDRDCLSQVKEAAGAVKDAASSAGDKAKDFVGQGCAFSS